MRYRVEYGSHPDVGSVHLALRDRLARNIVSFEPGEGDQATGEHAAMIGRLLDIRGVTGVFVQGYHITVHKDPIFTWDTVMWDTLQIITAEFGGVEAMEEVGDPIIQPRDPEYHEPALTTATIN